MLIKPKYKIITVKIGKIFHAFPVVKNSYLYTLWVLSHKYKDIILCDVNSYYYDEVVSNNITIYGKVKELEHYSRVHFSIPLTTPKIIMNWQNKKEVINYLGPDECMLLFGEKVFEELVQLLRKDINLNTPCVGYISFFDSYLVHLQIQLPKTNGNTAMLYEHKIYKYSSKNRKQFNNYANKIRDLRRIQTNVINKIKNTKNKNIELSEVEREYYISQIQSFVNTYFTKENIERRT